MHSPSSMRIDPEVAGHLRDACPEGFDYLPLDRFVDFVLYHPEFGYYRSGRKRVGRDRNADFYTASSIHDTFAGLVVASIQQLLGEDCRAYTFVEIGPESESGIIGALDSHPFKSATEVHPGSKISIPDKAVVFSNELFDAQPFRRFIHHSGKWKEAGVRVRDREIDWILMPAEKDLPSLPKDCCEGYVIDWPQGCHRLLDEIVRQPWTGLFIAFDYGLDSRTVFSERPQGTARTYSRHKMGTNLLERPGEIDITHHVIWDLMEEILGSHGFSDVQLLRQEAFFMQSAQSAIQHIMETSPMGFDKRKQSLMELIHPGNMGHKFQVLSARRAEI